MQARYRKQQVQVAGACYVAVVAGENCNGTVNGSGSRKCGIGNTVEMDEWWYVR